jgi:hypothetical protein
VILGLGLLTFAATCRLFDEFHAGKEYGRVVAGILSLACVIVLMPGKFLYLWFPGAWLLMASVALAAEIVPMVTRARQYFLIAFGVCVWLAASTAYFHEKAILWTLPEDQSLTVNMNRVRAEIPAGVGVMTTEYWWALADRDRVYDTLFSKPSPDDVSYIVVSGNGSGQPATPYKINAAYETGDFEPIYEHLNPTPESIFGFRIAHSAYGFGAYILKKKTAP